jgi:hypothetical protein
VDPSGPRTNWIRHAAAPWLLHRVASALEAEGIRILPVKGVLTAHLLYEDAASRPLPDIDLRVRRRDFAGALRIARARGWPVQESSPVLWNAMFKVDGIEVDVEASIGPPGLCALRVENLFDRATECVAPFGFRHQQPAIADHALILVLNAFKDGLRPMRWAVDDLLRIIDHPTLDPDELLSRAHEGRVSSALWIVADWLARDHASLSWGEVRDRVGPRPPSRRVASAYAFLLERSFRPKPALIVTAASSDDSWRSLSGLALAAAGIARRRTVLALKGSPR